MKYEIAMFDLDGTIVDSVEDIKDCVNHILTEYGFPQRTLEEILSFIGHGSKSLIMRSLPDGTAPEVFEQVYASFLPYYRDNCNNKTKPFDGIIDVLKKLKENGVKLAVISNKPDSAAQKCCEESFNGLFDYVTGQKPGAKVKPDPTEVNYVLETFGISPDKAAYIGDSEVDVKTGHNAGMHSIAVTWGFRSVDVLKAENPDFMVSTREELLNVLM